MPGTSSILGAALILSAGSAFPQAVVEYEVLPESEFQYGYTDDAGVVQTLEGNIQGLCRVVLRQREGETALFIDSLHMTTLTDPEITLTGGGRWDIGYGSAEVGKFGLQFAQLEIQTELGSQHFITTFLEPTVASVGFPALYEGLIGNGLGIAMRMAPAGDSIRRFFRRGDVDGDEDKDLGDAMAILLHLFQAGEAPACLDAEDTNDDGQIDLGDAVYVLNRLFLGGPRSPMPSQHCGLDPTEDDLDCQGQQACMTIDSLE